jgi:hypothetical protein
VQPRSGSATDLNFELKNGSNAPATAQQSGKKKTHMVYMPSQTGSNLGGRWIEVDDQTDINSQQTVKSQKATAAALGRMQGGTTSGSNGGSGN